MNEVMFHKLEDDIHRANFRDTLTLFTIGDKRYKLEIKDITDLRKEYIEYTYFYENSEATKTVDLDEIIEFRIYQVRDK